MIFLARHFAILFIVTCMLFFVGVMTVSAQFETMLNTAGSVTVETSPEFPREGQVVTIRLVSFLVDLPARRIIWRINGEVVASDFGLTEIRTTAGATGERTLVEAEIILPNEVVRKRYILVPGGLDLLWEAPYAYVPPFYRGKALPARESEIRATAIPRITSFANPEEATNYIYTWEHNYTVRGSLSGYGRSMFSFSNLFTRNIETVGVSMRNNANTFSAKDEADIVFVNPEILFYINDPELGIRPYALDNRIVSQRQNELNLIAEPYYFSPPQGNTSLLEFNWRAGNEPLQGRGDRDLKRSVTLQSNQSGQTFISVEVDNMQTFLQNAINDIQVTFR